MDQAELTIGDQKVQLQVIEGTENEKAIDISKLRAQTGLITLDPGYVNTGSCQSSITYIDGEAGILRYRGYAIEELCRKADFLETAHLLLKGTLPDQDEYDGFYDEVMSHALVDKSLEKLMEAFPRDSHPMAMLLSSLGALSTIYSYDTKSEEATGMAIMRLLGKMPTLAAMGYRRRCGLPVVYPDSSLGYVGNFLKMMFEHPARHYELDQDVMTALELLLILHADHEQNCSAATVRVIGSSMVNLYAAVAGGVCALWGPLHGGANQKVLEMLARILDDGGNIRKYLEMAKDKDNPFRLMGFGHRVYKNFDPRARIIKKYCDVVLDKLGIHDPLLALAKKLEEAALEDPYFAERKLYPNVDFYSGIIYKAIGIPVDMFTVMFAMGRLPGWMAQWRELMADPALRIGRPRQIYQGEALRPFQTKVARHR